MQATATATAVKAHCNVACIAHAWVYARAGLISVCHTLAETMLLPAQLPASLASTRSRARRHPRGAEGIRGGAPAAGGQMWCQTWLTAEQECFKRLHQMRSSETLWALDRARKAHSKGGNFEKDFEQGSSEAWAPLELAGSCGIEWPVEQGSRGAGRQLAAMIPRLGVLKSTGLRSEGWVRRRGRGGWAGAVVLPDGKAAVHTSTTVKSRLQRHPASDHLYLSVAHLARPRMPAKVHQRGAAAAAAGGGRGRRELQCLDCGRRDDRRMVAAIMHAIATRACEETERRSVRALCYCGSCSGSAAACRPNRSMHGFECYREAPLGQP